MNEKALFGPAACCQTHAEVIQLLKSVVGNEGKMAVAAYGMMVGARLAPGGIYFEDALEVLNCLAGLPAFLPVA